MKLSPPSPLVFARALRYGLNGVGLRRADAGLLADHLERGARRKPPDHLFAEWHAARRRRAEQAADPNGHEVLLNEQQAARRKPKLGARGGGVAAFRHNLFEHVGASSAVGNAARRFAPACYELLYDWLGQVRERLGTRTRAPSLSSERSLPSFFSPTPFSSTKLSS